MTILYYVFRCGSLITPFLHGLLVFVGAVQCVHAHPLTAVRRGHGACPAHHDSPEFVQLRSPASHLVPSPILWRHVLRQRADQGTGNHYNLYLYSAIKSNEGLSNMADYASNCR